MLSFSSMLLGCEVLAPPPLLGPLDGEAVPWRDCSSSNVACMLEHDPQE
jgi:hypothetical protein